MDAERIIIDPAVCHGQPVIKGTRIMAYLILELLESGLTSHEIIDKYYPQLVEDDIKAVIAFAAALVRNEESVPFSTVPCSRQ